MRMLVVSKIYGLVAASLLVTACVRENSPRREHEAANRTESTTLETSQELIRPTLNPDEIKSLRANASDFVARFRVRMDLKNLEKEKRAQTPEQRRELFQYLEEAGEMVANLPTEDASRKAILTVFDRALTAGCDSTLANCRYSSLFKANQGAMTMTLAIAEISKPYLERRYAILGLAFTLVGQIDDPRIAIAYLETSREYEASLASGRDADSRARLVRHREIIDLSLAKIRSTATPLIGVLEKSFDIWNFERPREPQFATREQTLLTLVAPKLLQEETLRAQLKTTAENSKSAIPKLAKVPAAARRALGIEEALPQNLTTLLLDNLWTGRLTSAEADIFWKTYLDDRSRAGQSTATTVTATQTELLNYARTRLLLSAQEANAIMTDFFGAKEKFATANAFEEGLKESLKGQTLWADSIRRFETIRQFSDRNLRSADSSDKNSQELDLFFASINRNIKILSTYPSMLVMSYHLARLGFSLKMRTWTGTIEIHAGQILDWFFDGTLDPWMAYGSDYRRISKSEITMVFYYALETGLLKQGGVDLDHMFKMLTEQMAGPVRADVQKIDDAYRTAYEESPAVSDFYRLCSSMERNKNTTVVVGAPKIGMQALQTYLITGMPQASTSDRYIHPTLYAGWSFFENERLITKMRLDENLEVVRLELTPKIDRLRLLSRLTDDYANRHGLENATTLKKSIETRIRPLEELRTRTYTRLFRLTKQIGPCGEKLLQEELQSQESVLRGMIHHFRAVHTAMKTRRAQEKNSTESQTLDKRFGFTGKVNMGEIEKHESGLGFTGEAYRMSRLQVALHFKSILENGVKDGDTVLPPKREKDSIMLPTRLRDIETGWREQTLRLDWNDDADEFATNGIQQIFDPRTGFVSWSNMTLTALSAQLRIRAMVAFAKAGTVQTSDGPQRIEIKEIIRQNLAMQKWIEASGPVWTSVLNITGEYTRVPTAMVLDKFAWEKSSRAWLGLLDSMFDQLILDKMGEGDGDGGEAEAARFTRRTGPMVELGNHLQVLKVFGEPTLKVPESSMKELTEFYSRAFDAQMKLIPEFVNEVKRLEPLRAANPEIFPSWRLYSSRKAPTVPMLSTSPVQLFRSKVLEFGRQTGYKLPGDVQAALDERVR